MNNTEFFIYLLIMAGTTYLIRAIPFAVVKEKTDNVTIKSFLYYIPYAVLTAMTVPAVFYATGNVISALAGIIIAIVLALRKKGLLTVAVGACLAVYIAEIIMNMFN